MLVYHVGKCYLFVLKLFPSSPHSGTNISSIGTQEQMMILSDFVKQTVPNWPSNLTLHEFVQHMTLDHEALVRNKVQSEHGYDIFLNPAKEENLREEIDKINDHMKGYFMEMDITEPEVNSLMLGLLWFSVFPCKEVIVGHLTHFRTNLSLF